MGKIIGSAFLVLGLVIGGGSFSATIAEDEKIVTLEEAIRLALEHNLLLVASHQDLALAEAEKKAAYSALYPKLELSETYMHTNNPVSSFGTLLNQSNFTSADFALDRLNHPEALDNFRSAITWTQPIYNGNRESLGLRLAHIGHQLAEDNNEVTRQRVIFSVTEAYYRLFLAKEQFKVAQEAYQVSEEDLRQIRSRYAQGLSVKSDLLGAEARLANVKEERIRAENGVKVARIVLKNAIGLSEEIEVGEGFENIQGTLPDFESLKGEAKGFRPDYRMLRHELDRTEVQVKLARSGFLPSLNLQGNYETYHRTLVRDGSDNYTVMALLSLNLFNGFNDQAQVSKAKAQQEKLKALLVERGQGIELEVTEAYLDLTAAQERIQVYEGTVKQMEEHLRIIRNRYQTGISTILDLLTAQHLLTQAQTAKNQALYDYAVGLARLDLVTGKLEKR